MIAPANSRRRRRHQVRRSTAQHVPEPIARRSPNRRRHAQFLDEFLVEHARLRVVRLVEVKHCDTAVCHLPMGREATGRHDRGSQRLGARVVIEVAETFAGCVLDRIVGNKGVRAGWWWLSRAREHGDRDGCAVGVAADALAEKLREPRVWLEGEGGRVRGPTRIVREDAVIDHCFVVQAWTDERVHHVRRRILDPVRVVDRPPVRDRTGELVVDRRSRLRPFASGIERRRRRLGHRHAERNARFLEALIVGMEQHGSEVVGRLVRQA